MTKLTVKENLVIQEGVPKVTTFFIFFTVVEISIFCNFLVKESWLSLALSKKSMILHKSKESPAFLAHFLKLWAIITSVNSIFTFYNPLNIILLNP